MKDYTIWLKGGGCIEGTMDDNEADRLKEFAKTTGPAVMMINQPEEFIDTDGSIILNRSDIAAIAINKSLKKEKVGFAGN